MELNFTFFLNHFPVLKMTEVRNKALILLLNWN